MGETRETRDAQDELAFLHRRAAELEKLQAISSSLISAVSKNETLRLIVESLVSLGYCFGAFLALDKARGVLTDYVLSTVPFPPIPEARPVIPASAELPLTCTENLAVRSLQTRGVQITDDLAEITVPLIGAVTARLVQRAAGLVTIAVVPVWVGNQPFGVWLAGSSVKGALDAADLRTLVAFANQAGLAIERAQLYDHLYEKTETLEKALGRLKSTQDQLIRSERLSSMGRLAASIAHEINSPLQVVRSCLELALEGMEQGRPVEWECVAAAHQEVGRVIQISRGLLNLQRPSEEQEAPVDVNNALREVLGLLRRQFGGAHIELQVTEAQDLPAVWSRSSQLKQVFLNLGLNALEAMPKGGRLNVATARAPGRRVEISFTDTGPGIPGGQLPRIFEAFYTTKAQGLGLGLTVCQTIVEAHNGSILVESEPGWGSSFHVLLPAWEQNRG